MHHSQSMDLDTYEFIDQEPPLVITHVKPVFFAIADLHFCHKNVMNYEPIRKTVAKDVEAMNDLLFENWNKIVGVDDYVLLLGDVCLGNAAQIGYWCGRLNGHKILVMGNHDRRKTVTFWRSFFREVYKTPIQINDTVYSHEPVSPDYLIKHRCNWNTHGHTHSKFFDNMRYDCVSVEQTDFRPVKITVGP